MPRIETTLATKSVVNKSVIDRFSKSQIDELEKLLQRVEARCEKCGEVKSMYLHQGFAIVVLSKKCLRQVKW